MLASATRARTARATTDTRVGGPGRALRAATACCKPRRELRRIRATCSPSLRTDMAIRRGARNASGVLWRVRRPIGGDDQCAHTDLGRRSEPGGFMRWQRWPSGCRPNPPPRSKARRGPGDKPHTGRPAPDDSPGLFITALALLAPLLAHSGGARAVLGASRLPASSPVHLILTPLLKPPPGPRCTQPHPAAQPRQHHITHSRPPRKGPCARAPLPTVPPPPAAAPPPPTAAATG